jgi:ABC-2 type transport system ATP-binding protein
VAAGEPAVVVRGVEKTYPGGVRALRGVSLEARRGEVVAVVGPNGAGKTTTLRIIVGLIRPDSGEVLVLGVEPWRGGPRLKRKIGYLPEDAGVYKRMSGLEFLRFVASLYASTPEEAEEMVWRAVRLSGLGRDQLERPMGSYSKGMRRRLLVARTLMTQPEVVVLDEPTAGVDVEHAVAIRREIRRQASRGAAVIVSSHNMIETETLADRVYIISGGCVVAEGAPERLREEYEAENLEEVYLKATGAAEGGEA